MPVPFRIAVFLGLIGFEALWMWIRGDGIVGGVDVVILVVAALALFFDQEKRPTTTGVSLSDTLRDEVGTGIKVPPPSGSWGVIAAREALKRDDERRAREKERLRREDEAWKAREQDRERARLRAQQPPGE